MATPIAIDTPDGQVGIVNPQSEIFSGIFSGGSGTFGVPPNAETLIILATAAYPINIMNLLGVTSGITYPGVKLVQGAITGQAVFIFDAAPSVDQTMRIGGGSPGNPLSIVVYADSGVHIVADTSKLANQQGLQYVVPSAPGPLLGDHPPNELSLAGQYNVAAGGVLVAAPGAGKRLRVFSANVVAHTAGAIAGLYDAVTASYLVFCGSGTSGTVSGYPSGIPLSANSGIVFGTSAGNASGSVTYTTETI
jgi:hypothetical protein